MILQSPRCIGEPRSMTNPRSKPNGKLCRVLHIHINSVPSPHNRERRTRTKLREDPEKQFSSRSFSRYGRSKSPVSLSSRQVNISPGNSKRPSREDNSPARIDDFSHAAKSLFTEDTRDDVVDEMNNLTEKQLLKLMKENPTFCTQVKKFVQSKEYELKIEARPPRSPRSKQLPTNNAKVRMEGNPRHQLIKE